jgi:hypothetical protein
MLNKQNIRYLSPLALLTLSACGGSSTVATSTASTVAGNVIKGPLSNALAFLDLDKDGVQDSGEPSVRTGSDGSYSLSTTATDYNLVAITDGSTTDTSTGAVLAGVTLSASKGASVITPLTTMMEQGNLTVAQVTAIFGLPTNVDPTTYNPFDTAADGYNASNALAVELASQQIMTVVTAFAAAGEGAGATATASFAAAMKAVIAVVKVKADAGTTIDLTNTADLESIRDNAKTEMAKELTSEQSTAFDSLAASTTTAVKNVTTKIGLITDTNLSSAASKNIFTTTQALSDQMKDAAIAEVETPGSGAAIVTFTSESTVNTAASNTAPTDINLSANSISELASSLVVGTVSTVDADQSEGVAHTYSIAEVAGSDHAAFEINSATGELSLIAQPDYETKTSYSVTILSKDEGGKPFSKEFTINVIDVEEAAFGIKLDAVTWTDYDPGTATDIESTASSITTGGAVSFGSEAIKLNLTNLTNYTDGNAETVGKAPAVKFTLDSVPSVSGTGKIIVTLVDGNDATRGANESQISLEVDVNYSGNGTTATLTVPAQEASGSYTKGSDGSNVTFKISNLDSDAFSITAANAVSGLPGSLDVKLGALYEAFVSGAGDASLLAAGTYNLKVETTLPLQDAANNAVTSFGTNVELVASTPTGSFYGTGSGAFGIKTNEVSWTDYNPATETSINNTAFSTTAGAAVSLGAESLKLNLTNLTNFTDDNAATIGKAPVLKFTLDSVPVGTNSSTVKVTLVDGSDATRGAGESAISLEVDVNYSGNGTTAKLSVPVQEASGSYTKGSDGTNVTFKISNLDGDAFSITSANEVTGLPASLDVKLGALYNAFVSGAGDSSLLAAGTYNLKLETTLPLQDAADTDVTSFTSNVELVSTTPIDTLTGTASADTLTGGSTAEVIDAGKGVDTISTGAGDDIVVLRAGDGANTVATDTVSDFVNGTDKFQLNGGLTFTDLTIAVDASHSANSVISTGTGSSIEYLMVVAGVSTTDLDTNDFVVSDIA